MWITSEIQFLNFVKSHFTFYFFLRLVKYLHFSDLLVLFPAGIIRIKRNGFMCIGGFYQNVTF